MADEPDTDESETDVENFFANDVFVDIGESDISLLFSFNFLTRTGRKSRPGVRVVLSHDNYIRMADFIDKRAVLLRRAYMNRKPNLYSGDQEELRKAFDELYPPVQGDAPDETPLEEKVENEDSSS